LPWKLLTRYRYLRVKIARSHCALVILLVFVLLVEVVATAQDAEEQEDAAQAETGISTDTYAALPPSRICVEAETGLVLFEENADVERPPASMIKLMLMLLVDEGVAAGRWTYDQLVTVSRNAQQMGGSQAYLKEGEQLPLETLMLAVAVMSANDAAMAVADGLWGSVDAYLKEANQRAAELGMTRTVIRHVHGLPPSDKVSFDLTTARDMALLGRACASRPGILRFTGTSSFVLRPGENPRDSTNTMLKSFPGCDGLKTGYIRASGFCVTLTAKRNDIRLVGVFMGYTKPDRFKIAAETMEACFPQVSRVSVAAPGMVIGRPVTVRGGVMPSVNLVVDRALSALIRTGDRPGIRFLCEAPAWLDAPVEAGVEVGMVRLVLPGKTEGEYIVLDKAPLRVATAVAKKTLWQRAREWFAVGNRRGK